MTLAPTPEEQDARDGLIAELQRWIRENRRVVLGPRGVSPFEGRVGPYAFAFEGEDDLLHLWVWRRDASPLRVEEAQRVVAFAVPEVDPGVIWLKPAERSHHFYFGHDELVR
ncbi:MAG: hypothetical protein M9921_06655 [Fimbriimonadaceae bacterium]|nr:hypothetical protein [Chthonomonadaceae bacterium]MCO5296518.1 hypothetical protein [Fimbriimonadaceae bacterium]